MAGASLAWVLAQPQVTSCIVGARNADQVSQNVALPTLTQVWHLQMHCNRGLFRDCFVFIFFISSGNSSKFGAYKLTSALDLRLSTEG